MVDQTWHADARMPGLVSAASSKKPQSILTAQCVTRSHRHTEAEKTRTRNRFSRLKHTPFLLLFVTRIRIEQCKMMWPVCILSTPLSWLYFVFPTAATEPKPSCSDRKLPESVAVRLCLFGNSFDAVHPTDLGSSSINSNKKWFHWLNGWSRLICEIYS